MTQEDNPSGGAGFGAVHATDEPPSRRILTALPPAFLVLTAALVGLDVASDSQLGESPAHLAVELSLMALALLASIGLWTQLHLTRRRARALAHDLVRARADLTRFREDSKDHLRGLAGAMDRQFERWGLSSAEREVALLLLKGLALKEIGEVRSTSERTVRQQALGIYKKAGLGGRAELSAFFLEDLLAPPPAAAPRDRPRSGAEGR